MMKIIKYIVNKWKYYKYSRIANLGHNVEFGFFGAIENDGARENVVIGNNVTMHGLLNVRNNGRLEIGDYTTIRYKTEIDVVNKIKIGSYVIISNTVIVSDNNSHPTDVTERQKMCLSGHDSQLWQAKYSKSAAVNIGDGVWIGRRSLINKGVVIGPGSIIAAGSVVTKSAPENSLIYGNPAKYKENQF